MNLHCRPTQRKPARLPWAQMLRWLIAACLVQSACSGAYGAPSVKEWLSATNLTAWCIVPFDTRERSPEERAKMLEKLGFSQFAYDWRSKHVPSFDAEVEALKQHNILLRAWWFPADLNQEAKAILACIEKHHIHPELWVMLSDPAPQGTQQDKVAASVRILAPIAAEAARLGCKIGLYNHGGWFGEPENQLAILDALHADNAGLVYNLHHGHSHLGRFAALMHQMQPHLLCVNLNGMIHDGEETGKKIVPFGQGEDDLSLLRAIRDSGYRGPLGILGHTEEDAEIKLSKDLAGFKRLAAALLAEGQPQTKTGSPKASGGEPADQSEADWADNRWQQTDVGPMLACNLAVPGGVIPKGLAINLDSRGGIAYDTASLAVRAAWTGKFLTFDSRRFGLITPPKPDGQIAWSIPQVEGWPGSTHRLNGIHLSGAKVILDYQVNGAAVLESPELLPGSESIFVRAFNIGPCASELRFVAGGIASTNQPGRWEIGRDGSSTLATFKEGSVETGVLAAGTDAELRAQPDGTLVCVLPASRKRRRFSVAQWRGEASHREDYKKAAGLHASSRNLEELAASAAPRWPQVLTTEGKLGDEKDFLAVDTLTMPYENPWHALLFAAGADFDPSGAAYLCTIHGDVWKIDGIGKDLRQLHWRRFATGLFQPLGLKVRDGEVFVLGRDRITRLRDQNHDGEADFYENFCDLIGTSRNGHDYVTSLEKDRLGNFYYVDPSGVHKVSPDGTRSETLASGFRNPNGLGVNEAGSVITVAPQQGEWTPSSVICEIRQGGYYGYPGPQVSIERPQGFDPPLCYLPHGVDNSSGGQVWIPPGHWGSLGGQAIHLLWGRCTAMLLLRDTNTIPQGAVVPLPVHFISGPDRAVFRTADDSLYVAGSTGWQTSALKDGCFQRVRFTGKPVNIPIGWRALERGVELEFPKPLDPKTATDAGSFALKQWNYRYQAEYGSKDWSVAHPEKTGRDNVEVIGARLTHEGRAVVIEAPIQPVMQMEITYNLDSATGDSLHGQVWLTLNSIPKTEVP